LHSSPAGREFGRANGALDVTDNIAARLVRLPLWIGLEAQHAEVIETVTQALNEIIR